MSRTIRGSKSPDYEYWSARPGNKYGGHVSKFTKKQTHKSERQSNKKLTQEDDYELASDNTTID
mgnify:CR=1 FL=1